MFTLTHRIDDEREEDEPKEHNVELLEAGEDPAESLQATEQTLDFVASLVHLPVVFPWLDPRTQWRHNGRVPQGEGQLAGLVAFICTVTSVPTIIRTKSTD